MTDPAITLDLTAVRDAAVDIAREGAEVLKRYFGGPLRESFKSTNIDLVTEADKAAEEAILRLRLLQEGLDINTLAVKYGDENIIGLASRLKQLVKEGLLRRSGSHYRLEPAYTLVSNPILARVLAD